MKKLIFVLACTLSVFAHASTQGFSDQQSWGSADQPCLYAHGDCDLDVMEANLQAKCYNAGYSSCITTVKKALTTRSGHDIFCGDYAAGKCFVTVLGSN